MSIPVTDLNPGERVTLFCPNARRAPRRDAVFEAVLSRDELISVMRRTCGVMLEGEENLTGGRYAIFLTQTADPRPMIFSDPLGTGARLVQLRHVMEVTDAGRLRDDEGRAVYIEARVAMGVG